MSKRFAGNLMLLLAAMIWGAAFVAQSAAMDLVEPFTFQGIRFIIGGLALLPVIRLTDRQNREKKPVTKAGRRSQLFSGLICGLILFVACTPQQLGLKLQISAGKSGFITSLYIILVPIFGMLFWRKKPGRWIWLSILLALLGLYLLCGMGGFSLDVGEALTLVCAIAFSFHILYIDHVGEQVDSLRLSCTQFFTAGIISLVIAFATEQMTLQGILACWLPILYTGLLSSSVAYTLQIMGQKRTDPVSASLLMSLESVFAAIFGWLIAGQTMAPIEIAGCALVFCGVILSQLPQRNS